MKTKLLTLLTLLILCVTGAWAETIWRVTSETVVTAATDYVDDDLLKVSTVYAGTVNTYSNTYDDGNEFTHNIQVRVKNAPSSTSATGTEQTGNTPLVITAKKDVKVTFYYRRQTDGGNANGGFTSNNGKDLFVVNQAAPVSKLLSTAFVTDTEVKNTSDEVVYGYVIKTYLLRAGTYTVYASGTTIALNGFSYTEVDRAVAYKSDYSDFTNVENTATAYMWIPKSDVDAVDWIDAHPACTSGSQKPSVFKDPATDAAATGSTSVEFYRPKDLAGGRSLTFYLTNITSVSFYAYNSSNGKTLKAIVDGGEEQTLATTSSSDKAIIGTVSGLDATKGHVIQLYNQSASSGASETYVGAIKVTLAKTNIPVSAAGLATYTAPVGLDLTDAENIAAYKASISGSDVTFTRVTAVAAGEGVLIRSLVGGATNEDITVDKDAAANAGNAFVGVTSTIDALASTSDGYDNYILNNGASGLGFYKANGQKVAAGKAYLRVTSGTDAKINLTFDDETTSISNISTNRVDDGKYYNLQGMEVKNPTKGLYIVNGKKVIIK